MTDTKRLAGHLVVAEMVRLAKLVIDNNLPHQSGELLRVAVFACATASAPRPLLESDYESWPAAWPAPELVMRPETDPRDRKVNSLILAAAAHALVADMMCSLEGERPPASLMADAVALDKHRQESQRRFQGVGRESMWLVHNLIAHPLCGVLTVVGWVFRPAGRMADWLHDYTAPNE